MKNSKVLFFVVLLLIAGLGGCSKKEDTLGRILFKEFRNPALKDVSPEEVAVLVKKKLNQGQLKHEKLIESFYRRNAYGPVLLKAHVPEGGIQALLERLTTAGEHGLSPALFQAAALGRMLDSLENKDALSSAGDAAALLAALEIQVASSLAGYGSAMQFGYTDPATVVPRYYREAKRPDSSSLAALFRAGDLKARLDSIQPDGAAYLALKQALSTRTTGPATGQTSGPATGQASEPATGQAARPGTGDTALDKDEMRRALIVNLERLRWKDKPAEEKYVIVNIADFRLQVINGGKPELEMKVCVGEPARRWQTPQLSSVIERVQVNPIWHIPKSIASGEIIKKAAQDPYYLENANINVYRGGELIADSREIDWSAVSGKNIPYTFKQRPGSQNALGKIKFLFDNQSSVYLHDTPAKAAFSNDMRAISHGCVRVEKPVELAYSLFGRGNKFELVKTEMGKENPEARYIELNKGVPVYLTYATCWPGENGNIEYRPDVYGLDSIVFSHLQPKDSEPLAAH